MKFGVPLLFEPEEISPSSLMNCHGQRCSCCFVTGAPISQGRYEDAEPFCRRVMNIAEETLGKDHRKYSINLSNLGWLLEKQVKASVCRCGLSAYLAERNLLSLYCSIFLSYKLSPAKGFPPLLPVVISYNGVASF